MTSNYQATVVIPREQAAKAVQDALDAQMALEAQVVAQPVESSYVAPTQFVDSLVGSIGYVSLMLNCVDFVKQFREVPNGNPISWEPTTQTPFIGALVLFPFNHVAYLTGIHSDGSIEVAHANCPGCATRYNQGEIRGYF